MNDNTQSAIIAAVNHIENRLKDELSVAEIADAACYSVFHFCRLFNSHCHISPWDYVMRRRLTEAANDVLTHEKRKLIEIAYDYQFNNPETFSRAFKRMFGITPSEMRKTHRYDMRRSVHPLDADFLTYMHSGAISPTPKIIDFGPFSIAGISSICQHDAVDARLRLWERFSEERRYFNVHGNVENWNSEDVFCVTIFNSEIQKKNDYSCMIGCKIDSDHIQNPRLSVCTIPSLPSCAVFAHNAPVSLLRYSYEYIYGIWFACVRNYRLPSYHIEHYPDAFSHNIPDDTTTDVSIIVPLDSSH